MQKRVPKKKVHIPSKKKRDQLVQRQEEYHKKFVGGFQKYSPAGKKPKAPVVKDLTTKKKKPRPVVKKKKLTLSQRTKKRLKKAFKY